MSPPKQTEWPEGLPAMMEPGAPDDLPPAMLTACLALPPVEDSAFDAWLRGHLNGLHAAVLSEPVPEHLLRLLRGQPS